MIFLVYRGKNALVLNKIAARLAAVPTETLAFRPDSLAKSGIGPVRPIVLEDEWLLTFDSSHRRVRGDSVAGVGVDRPGAQALGHRRLRRDRASSVHWQEGTRAAQGRAFVGRARRS